MDADNVVGVIYAFTGLLITVSLFLVIIIRRRNGHTKEAKEIAEAAGEISEASSQLVNSMSKYITLLQVQVEQRGDVPVNPNFASRTYDTAMLIDSAFTIEELTLLAASVGIDIEELTGDSRAAKALALVVAAQNRAKLWHLIENARKQRPNIPWPL